MVCVRKPQDLVEVCARLTMKRMYICLGNIIYAIITGYSWLNAKLHINSLHSIGYASITVLRLLLIAAAAILNSLSVNA